MLLSDRQNSRSEKHEEPEKRKLLDEFTSASGYHRKYAIRVLNNQGQVQNHLTRKTKTYQPRYRGEVVQALEQIGELYGRICSKGLQPIFPEALKLLEGCQEIELTQETTELLLKISSASLDRGLRPVRIKSPHGLSTTQPGRLLKNMLPVRTFTAWDQADLRLYLNCFQPSVKLLATERIGNQTIQRYDPAKTPYQRVFERNDISLEATARLINL